MYKRACQMLSLTKPVIAELGVDAFNKDNPDLECTREFIEKGVDLSVGRELTRLMKELVQAFAPRDDDDDDDDGEPGPSERLESPPLDPEIVKAMKKTVETSRGKDAATFKANKDILDQMEQLQQQDATKVTRKTTLPGDLDDKLARVRKLLQDQKHALDSERLLQVKYSMMHAIKDAGFKSPVEFRKLAPVEGSDSD